MTASIHVEMIPNEPSTAALSFEVLTLAGITVFQDNTFLAAAAATEELRECKIKHKILAREVFNNEH